MINNPNEYMNFRLGTHSQSEDEKDKKVESETQTTEETKPETKSEKIDKENEEKGEEKPDGTLKAHSVTGTWFSSFLDPMIEKIKTTEDPNKAAQVALVACALLLTLLDIISAKVEVGTCRDDIESIRNTIKTFINSEDTAKVAPDFGVIAEGINKAAACVEGFLSSDCFDEDDKEKIRSAISVTQLEAKNMGFETGLQSYSKMAVYSKADVIKAHLYLKELGWEQVGPATFRVPGTDDVVTVSAEGPDDDLEANLKSAYGSQVSSIKQSFDDFKAFIDRVISNRVGSYSEDEEFEDAMETVQERTEKGYSEDEVAEAVADVESFKELSASSEGETCPICGKEICECEKSAEETKPEGTKSEGELEANCGDDFKTRLMNKLGA